jgi:hypothetical protein
LKIVRTEKESSLPSVESNNARASKSWRCPADYVPSPSVAQWAAEKFPQVDFPEALEAMRDWEFKDGKRDWDAVLRNWIRTEAKKPQAHARGIPQDTRISAKGLRNLQSTKTFVEMLNESTRQRGVRSDA